MGKCKRVLRCYHCGSVLQTKDPKQKGYISQSEVGGDLTTNKILYCDRCFDVIRSFNNSALDLQIDQDILRILDDAIATDALIIWVIDLFAFNGALNPEIAKKVKKLKVVVVGNKLDLLPKGKEKGITEYINERFEEFGIKPHAVRLLGNSNKIDMSDLLNQMNKARQGHDVYLIGNALSGKTTLIKKLLSEALLSRAAAWPHSLRVHSDRRREGRAVHPRYLRSGGARTSHRGAYPGNRARSVTRI